ncbi:MAG: sodium:proton antiporter [Candidatus Thermoplasmatota archaeon]|nr:sodium:proton antiporter [Candidatus Thermoplasmatota archaeon]
MSPIVKTITKIAFAPIFLFGSYIILHGHLTPGGGFQGGAIIGTLMALYLIAFGAVKWRKKLLSIIESMGLLVFIGTAFLGLTSGYFFFNFIGGTGFPLFGEKLQTGELIDGVFFPSNNAPLLSSGTIAVMNISVGLEVIAGLTLIIVAMGLFAFTGKEGGE